MHFNTDTNRNGTQMAKGEDRGQSRREEILRSSHSEMQLELM